MRTKVSKRKRCRRCNRKIKMMQQKGTGYCCPLCEEADADT